MRAYRNLHADATVLVCGCGASLELLDDAKGCITIGVNDVGRKLTPDYLVVVNPRTQFTAGRLAHIERSGARAVFSQLGDLRLAGAPLVRFRLGTYGGTTPSSAVDALHYTQNSPYVAVCLAMHMGARRIGLIGVDFTGQHALAAQLRLIDGEYQKLAVAIRSRGGELVNLSPTSRLTSLPRGDLQEFLTQSAATSQSTARALNIISYATTPVAGVPEVLARCISARTRHRSQCVWATNDYGNGVRFEGGMLWKADPAAVGDSLRAADVVILHNGKVDEAHRRLLSGKPTITMAHNYAWNVERGWVERGFPGVVVGQYQATLPEFQGWRVVPNPMPWWESAFGPEAEAGRVRICYTPSGAHERYPAGHPLYWHSKGRDTTLRVLEVLAKRYNIALETTRGGQVSHAESLAMKRRSHIVIDECVTGSYHRNSLEGLAAGCVVVNGVGLVPAIEKTLLECTYPRAAASPFVFADLVRLESVLSQLIELGAEALSARGAQSRRWLEAHWNFSDQWERCWLPAVDAALAIGRAEVAMPALSSQRGAEAKSHDVAQVKPAAKLYWDAPATLPVATQEKHGATSMSRSEGVTVVIPHGGRERLKLLAATIGSLRQYAEVGQIIIAEGGEKPLARALAQRWRAEYVFTPIIGAFNKARVLNMASALARYDLVLWWDSDLLFSPPALSKAVAEMREKHFDVFFPYFSISYLDQADSAAVIQGVRHPADCRSIARLEAIRGAPGGLVLNRTSFIDEYGGLCEEFRGWGGEDSAWLHKVRLLGGKIGVSSIHAHVAYHLWHPDSGVFGGDPLKRNKGYRNNTTLWSEIASITSRDALLKRLPPPRHRPLPWSSDVRVGFLVDNEAPSHVKATAARWAAELEQYFGLELTSAADIHVAFSQESAPHVSFSSNLFIVSEEAATSRDVIWLVEQLSVALNNGATAGNAPASLLTESLPVWMYWEGSCPDWILACQDTIRRHVPNVRLLGPKDFDALWTSDRDIDIGRLHVPHRADFIRAYLLHRYGGLWIDSDCIVVKSLSPLLEVLSRCDFLAHRERDGYVSNAFLAARPGSVIAKEFYDIVVGTLRSRAPLSWISLGNEPLTRTLESTSACWFELDLETVQPICWSRPEAYFTVGTPASHARELRQKACCYMLSNQNILRHQNAHPEERLMQPDTLFAFLLNHSRLSTEMARVSGKLRGADPQLEVSSGTMAGPVGSVPASHERDEARQIFEKMHADHAAQGFSSTSGPGSTLEQTEELRQRLPLLLQHLEAHSLLDVACGDFFWQRHCTLGVARYLGTDVLESLIDSNQREFGDPARAFQALDARSDELPAFDVILCRDYLVHLSYDDIRRALNNFIASGSRYLITTTFTNRPGNRDIAAGDWRPLNLCAAPFLLPAPRHMINEKCPEGCGAFADKSLGVWLLADIQHAPFLVVPTD